MTSVKGSILYSWKVGNFRLFTLVKFAYCINQTRHCKNTCEKWSDDCLLGYGNSLKYIYICKRGQENILHTYTDLPFSFLFSIRCNRFHFLHIILSNMQNCFNKKTYCGYITFYVKQTG